jgi:hypothetical protein
MKTFKDLVFEPSEPELNGVKARIDFDNGCGASVIKNAFSYGGSAGFYELAVIKDGQLHYDNPVANGDVVGWLEEEEVSKLLIEIQNFEDKY